MTLEPIVSLEPQQRRLNIINRIVERFGYRIATLSAVIGLGSMLAPNEKIIQAGKTALEHFSDLAYLLPPVLALKAYENLGISPNVALGSIILLSSAAMEGLTFIERRRQINREQVN